MIIWNLATRSQIMKEFLPEIVEELIFFDKEKKFLIVTKETDFQNKYLKVTAVTLPQGKIVYKIQCNLIRTKAAMTCDLIVIQCDLTPRYKQASVVCKQIMHIVKQISTSVCI